MVECTTSLSPYASGMHAPMDEAAADVPKIRGVPLFHEQFLVHADGRVGTIHVDLSERRRPGGVRGRLAWSAPSHAHGQAPAGTQTYVTESA